MGEGLGFGLFSYVWFVYFILKVVLVCCGVEFPF